MQILMGDFNAKVIKEIIFKPTIGNESLYEISNNSGVKAITFATSKNLVIGNTMFPHCNIHKTTCTSPEGNTHNQIDHVLLDRRRHSGVLDVRSFRGADCDTDHYLVLAKVRERLAVSKRHAQDIVIEKFNLKNLKGGDVKEQYQITIGNKFTALGILEDNADVNGVWDNIRQNINISAKESLGYCE
jgi:hypothetical protein